MEIKRKEEIAYQIIPPKYRMGLWGLTSLLCSALLAACGFLLPGVYGGVLAITATVFFIQTAFFPSSFPQLRHVYPLFIGISVTLGTVLTLLTILNH